MPGCVWAGKKERKTARPAAFSEDVDKDVVALVRGHHIASAGFLIEEQCMINSASHLTGIDHTAKCDRCRLDVLCYHLVIDLHAI